MKLDTFLNGIDLVYKNRIDLPLLVKEEFERIPTKSKEGLHFTPIKSASYPLFTAQIRGMRTWFRKSKTHSAA